MTALYLAAAALALLVTYGLGFTHGHLAEWRHASAIIRRQRAELDRVAAVAAYAEAVLDEVLATTGDADADIRLWRKEIRR